ncbi:MAG: glycosyltransferase family 4 protein [Thaumarchaeota archaeon]|nr:MAG: glycosyltransferase family 4 protein [Nitrososphaerota archaeon]
MRILHLSDDGLPDWRVEKSALTGKKNGHDVFFGGRLNSNSHSTAFSEKYPVKWNAAAMIGIPYYYHGVKKQIERLVKLVRPDIVHSHNIGSAKVSHDLGLPFVFDDHEYFRMLSLVNAENLKIHDSTYQYSGIGSIIHRIKLGFISHRSVSNWTSWERDLVSSVPTITVSEQIAHDFRKMRAGSTKDIFVIPNFPLQVETTEFSEPQPHEKLSCVYAGGDSKYKQATNRDICGLPNLFMSRDIGNLTIIGWKEETSEKFKATGFLPREKMFYEMIQNSIGLIPWKKHWSHPFLNPNKAYEYAHAGLSIMVTSDLRSVIHTLEDNCLTFEDYDDLALKLQNIKTNMDGLYKKRLNIFNYARSNLIWEKYERNIISAYNSV